MPVPFGELKPCVYYTQGTRRYLCLLTTNATKSANWPGIRFLARASVRDEGLVCFLPSAVTVPHADAAGRRISFYPNSKPSGQQASNVYSCLCFARCC